MYCSVAGVTGRQPLKTQRAGERLAPLPGPKKENTTQFQPLTTESIMSSPLHTLSINLPGGNLPGDGDGRPGLSHSAMQAAAPSVFADRAHARVSPRYSFLPTAALVECLRAEGWAPVWAAEQRIRREDRRGFQKHMIRFARRDDLSRAQEERPELVLINSHDRTSAYQLHAGVFRFVCANGMILSDCLFARVSIPHIRFELARVIAASFAVVRQMPALADRLADYKAYRLTALEQWAFGCAALKIKYGSLREAPIGHETALLPRRQEDAAPTLWNTLNVLQENLLKGGQRNPYRRRPDTGRPFRRTRAVRGLDESVRVNKALWAYAEMLRGGDLDLSPPEPGVFRDRREVSLAVA